MQLISQVFLNQMSFYSSLNVFILLGPFLLKWINFNLSMDK